MVNPRLKRNWSPRVRVRGSTRVTRQSSVEEPNCASRSAVRYFDDSRAVAPPGVLGLQDDEVRRELDATGAVDRRMLQIGDDSIAWMRRIDFEVQCAHDLFVSGGSDFDALCDLDAG
jgi:hypothetical protein